MKLFTTTSGFIFSFGFDMLKRVPDHHMICWCDPQTKEWELKITNQAGNNVFPFYIEPEFVHETRDAIIVYHSGQCLEITYIGMPLVWSFKVLHPDNKWYLSRAA